MNSPDSHDAMIEQQAGPPLVDPVDDHAILGRTSAVFKSYESFLRDRLTHLNATRHKHWQRDYSSVDAYETSIEPMRDRLKAMLGFWVEPKDRQPAVATNRRLLLEHEKFTAYLFDLEVFDGISTYGIELIPVASSPHPGLLIQHGYGGTPEAACGFTADANGEDYVYRSMGIRAAMHGFHVIAVNHPTMTNLPEDQMPPAAGDAPHTQFGKNRLHRMAVMAGGALFGIDMMTSSRGIDLLNHCNSIGMYGLSQGGQSALFLTALDTRIKASVCSAYFNTRIDKLIGPHRALNYLDSNEEDKFFSEVISHFTDSELVSLIAPRAFAVEAGQHDGTIDFERSLAEFQRAKVHHHNLGLEDHIEFIGHAQGHVSATVQAFDFLKRHLHA